MNEKTCVCPSAVAATMVTDVHLTSQTKEAWHTPSLCKPNVFNRTSCTTTHKFYVSKSRGATYSRCIHFSRVHSATQTSGEPWRQGSRDHVDTPNLPAHPPHKGKVNKMYSNSKLDKPELAYEHVLMFKNNGVNAYWPSMCIRRGRHSLWWNAFRPSHLCRHR